MKIHEYQGKQLLAKYGVAVPRGRPAFSPAEARAAAQQIGCPVVLKAQIHAGGRGKGGGIKVAKRPDEAEKLSEAMIGMRLVTHQTGPEGKIVKRLLVEEALSPQKELYLGIIIDRAAAKVLIMASEAGGMEIEEVAQRSPELIIKEYVDPAAGLRPFQAAKMAYKLNLEGDLAKEARHLTYNLYRAFVDLDLSLAEINPLVATSKGELLALDAKVNFDDNALFRHPEAQSLRDFDEEEPLEVEASRSDLNYIRLSGSVGCMVNGAGLAMATMDLIKHSGGEPANFLDVGGAASAAAVENAFSIILSDANVRAVLINIFGGIVRCDLVARGIVEAISKMAVRVPVVVRLEGTNSAEAAYILRNSGLKFVVANGLSDAARKAVEAAAVAL